MTELLTSEQMRALEKRAMSSGEVSGLTLMERAGQGVVDAIFAKWPALDENKLRALVLCGPGNNGGDGFVIARLLAARGWQIELFLFGQAEKLPPDAKANHDRWENIGRVQPWDAEAIMQGPRPDLVIDAVFGIGLTRPLPAQVSAVLDSKTLKRWPRAHAIRKVAVDCPSGLNLDTGWVPSDETALPGQKTEMTETINRADLTVTFHTPKPGHYLALGPTLCGDLAIADIGLRGEAMERAIIGLAPDPERIRLSEPRHFGADGLTDLEPRYWPRSVIPKFAGFGHKYDHGHVVVFAGGVGRGGAGRMAARAALRIGAGLVTLVCPKAALMENAMHLDAVMLRGLDDPDALEEVADSRVSGFCAGPGMGVGARTRGIVEAILTREAAEKGGRRPAVVLDADAITSFQDDPETLFSLVHDRTVLTPHEGEFARLFPDLALSQRKMGSKVDAVRAAAERAGCVILLKGPDTVIAAPDGGACVHAAVYDRAVPWLATAGAGDVLAGLIAGLSGAPISPDPIVCAEAAAWLHVEAARQFGPGLIAEDLPDVLPEVLARLED